MAKNLLAVCLMFMVASSVVYEVQGHFLLKLYLKRKLFPRRCVDFTPYACKGMLMLVSNLEGGCPATREFKQFFSSFRAYLSFISSVSVSSSSNIDIQLKGQANSLFKSCKILQALRGDRSSSTSNFESTMMSMGKILIEQKRSGSIFLSLRQKRELVIAMVQWTRILATFVKTAAEKSGKLIDISNYGLDVDVNQSIGSGSSPSDESSSPKSTSSPTPTNSGSSPTPATPSTTGSSPTPTTPTTTGSSPTPATPSTTGSSPTPTTPTTTGSSPTPTTPTTSGSVDQSASSTKTRSGSKTKESSDGSTYTDTTGSKPETPSGSPTPTSPATTTSSGSSKKKESASGSSQKTESSGKAYSDTTGTNAVSPTPSTSSPTPSTSTPTPSSTSPTTSSSGSENKESKSARQTSSSSSTSVKQVETETSSEVMSFISELEKKYTSNAELKVFFDKLKASMSATSIIATSNSQDLVSGMRAAAGKLAEAMMFVRSRFSKSAETKTTMESCQEQVMNSLKQLQVINSEIASAKTVTSTQKTELKQTLTKWEQVTTQFVETAASSSSSSSTSSKSQQTSGSSQKQQTSAMNS